MTGLLIVGGLTIDRFPDGTSAPGGSVLHSGRAAAAEGVRPAILTVAGQEPEARDGLSQLAALAELTVQPSPRTTTYRHDESRGRRILVLDVASAPIQAPPRPPATDGAMLMAPIAGEVSADAMAALRRTVEPTCTVMLMQGWLRRLGPGRPVEPLPLDEVSDALWVAFGASEAVVLSTEDLADPSADPFTQAAELRRRLGPGPILVLTLGAEGYLLDDPAADRIVAAVPRRVVEGVPMVGAGDTFGAALAVRLARGERPQDAAEAATELVIRTLESRR